MSDCPTIGEGNSHLFWEKGIKRFNWNTNTPGKGDHVWVVVCSLLKCWRIFIKLFDFQTRSVGWTSETNETIEIKMSGSGELYLYFTVSLTQAYYFGVSTLVYNSHCVCPTHWNSSSSATIFLQQIISTNGFFRTPHRQCSLLTEIFPFCMSNISSSPCNWDFQTVAGVEVPRGVPQFGDSEKTKFFHSKFGTGDPTGKILGAFFF